MATTTAKSTNNSSNGTSQDGQEASSESVTSAANGSNGSTKTNGKTAQTPKKKTIINRIDDLLFEQIDIAPLIYFRVCYGCILLWEVYRAFTKTHIERYFITPTFHFKYHLWEWTPGPLPGKLMYIFFVVQAMLYVFIILGLWYRVSTVLSFIGMSYWFFLDMATYLNHLYLVLLINFAMIFMPAHCNASLDVYRYPELRVSKVPAWSKYVLTFLVSVPYFFGALAKITPDWLAGEPMKMWLISKKNFPVVGPLFKEWWACYFFSWCGLVFDFVIVPLLLWKRTRVFAVVNTLFFHLMNDNLFKIGIFPWFMMFATPIYFEPEWVRFALEFEYIFCKPIATTKTRTVEPNRRPIVRFLVLTFCGILFIMPFRHYFYPGPTMWTEEGYLYSWQMMLRDKTDSFADFKVHVTDEDKKTEIIEIDNNQYLANKIQRTRMPQRPDMVLNFAHYLCDIHSTPTNEVSVYVQNFVGMNGRIPQTMVDPNADLCQEKLHLFRPASWIVPLKVPLDMKSKAVIDRYSRNLDPESYIGRRVAKRVDGVLYLGTLTNYDESQKKWRVTYDNGDERGLDRQKLVDVLFRYQMEGQEVDNGSDKDSDGGDKGQNVGQEKEKEEAEEVNADDVDVDATKKDPDSDEKSEL